MKLNVTEIKALSGLLRYLAKDASEVGGAAMDGQAIFITDTFQRIDAESKLSDQQLKYILEICGKTRKTTEELQSRLPADATEAMHRVQAILTLYGGIIKKVENELQQPAQK